MVLEIFYGAVVQVIILYGLETWVISVSMQRKMEGLHTGIFCQIT